MDRIIIALVGPMVSGKGDVSKYLKSLGFSYSSLSDRCREEVDRRGIARTRPNLQDVGNDLRLQYGLHVLAERTADLLADTPGHIVIDGVRNPGEIAFLREELGATIIGIDAPVELRLERYLIRAEERGEEEASEEAFIRNNNRDYGIGEPEGGQQVGLCLAMADLVILNDGSKKKLHEAIDYHLILDFGFSPEGHRRSAERK